ncbi:uncharacterized protein FRV6_10234 [Fusarium oxysporum]|uniref:Uncharacterized protein n=1 Tax=Fusarium oxysporum TaxID=5507 RepID=A0A2H3TC24_FUSOX|nr:uncharacterized protein FRV6_10234 [Fusarium oxysporum]
MGFLIVVKETLQDRLIEQSRNSDDELVAGDTTLTPSIQAVTKHLQPVETPTTSQSANKVIIQINDGDHHMTKVVFQYFHVEHRAMEKKHSCCAISLPSYYEIQMRTAAAKRSGWRHPFVADDTHQKIGIEESSICFGRICRAIDYLLKKLDDETYLDVEGSYKSIKAAVETLMFEYLEPRIKSNFDVCNVKLEKTTP